MAGPRHQEDRYRGILLALRGRDGNRWHGGPGEHPHLRVRPGQRGALPASRLETVSMNEKTNQMLNKLVKRHGLYKHIRPGEDTGGLCGTEPGTFWINWDPHRQVWKVKPPEDSWAIPVRIYLRSVAGPPTDFLGVDGWHVTDDEKVVEEAVRIMAHTQGL
jgi:hypothetical protein